MREILSGVNGDMPLLTSSKTGQTASLATAFAVAVESTKLFADLFPNGPAKNVCLHITYDNDEDHFVVTTRVGTIRVVEIIFEGEILIVQNIVPLAATSEYLDAHTGYQISEVAAFQPMSIQGTKISFELHRIAESGETYPNVRKVVDD